MDEYFLQYLWRFQKFQSQPHLTDGTPLTVFHPGHLNSHAGPDFQEAKVAFGDVTWSGSVEIHHRASDWKLHGHSGDMAYENVILHVVWLADIPILNQAGEPIPTLELSRIVSTDLENEYRRYINQPQTIRCGDALSHISQLQLNTMLDKAFAERLKSKASHVLQLLDENEQDWEETAYQLFARNFGFKTNGNTFESLGKKLPFRILKKHLDHPAQVEALLFGMAGFLENPSDAYQEKLAQEFSFLQKKYQLPEPLLRHEWKFARMRPANFPTVRLAQFTAIVLQGQRLFAALLSLKNLKDANLLVKKPLTDYWQAHYDFGKKGKGHTIGKSSVENLLINTVVPLLVAYAKYADDLHYLEKAESLLFAIPAERNHITQAWHEWGVHPKHAADSQALIHQYRFLCEPRKCLQCNIGLSLLHK